MKKALIVGAASVALAAMPLVSTFAYDFRDTLSVTLDNNCAFLRKGSTTTSAHGANETWNRGENTNANVDTINTVTLSQGVADQTIGSSIYTVRCNNIDGYTITLATDALARTAVAGSDAQDATAESWPFSGVEAAASGSSWFINLAGAAGTASLSANGGVIDTDGEIAEKEITVTYKATVSATQTAGTYTTNADYTFAQL